MKIQRDFIEDIKILREQYPEPPSHTITPIVQSRPYHLDILDETIFCFENGRTILTIIGACLVVESCLVSEYRRSVRKEVGTFKEYFEKFKTLNPLIKHYIDDPIVPIKKLLDTDEDIKKIKKGICTSKFAELRNKVAHGDYARLQAFQKEIKPYLPSKEELINKYKVKGNQFRWDVASYVQLRKCITFCLTWE